MLLYFINKIEFKNEFLTKKIISKNGFENVLV